MSDVGGGHRVQTAESATVTGSRGDKVRPWPAGDEAMTLGSPERQEMWAEGEVEVHRR